MLHQCPWEILMHQMYSRFCVSHHSKHTHSKCCHSIVVLQHFEIVLRAQAISYQNLHHLVTPTVKCIVIFHPHDSCYCNLLYLVIPRQKVVQLPSIFCENHRNNNQTHRISVVVSDTWWHPSSKLIVITSSPIPFSIMISYTWWCQGPTLPRNIARLPDIFDVIYNTWWHKALKFIVITARPMCLCGGK